MTPASDNRVGRTLNMWVLAETWLVFPYMAGSQVQAARLLICMGSILEDWIIDNNLKHMEGLVKYPNFQFPSTNKHLTAGYAHAFYEISLQHGSLAHMTGNGTLAVPFIRLGVRQVPSFL